MSASQQQRATCAIALAARGPRRLRAEHDGTRHYRREWQPESCAPGL
jgi:hypothetical protein